MQAGEKAAPQSQSLWRPFKPASYQTHGECMRSLLRQGNLAFFKGNFTRSVHILLFHKLNTYFTFTAEGLLGPTWKQMKEVPVLTEFLLSTTVDMILQPLHVAETRFTL